MLERENINTPGNTRVSAISANPRENPLKISDRTSERCHILTLGRTVFLPVSKQGRAVLVDDLTSFPERAVQRIIHGREHVGPNEGAHERPAVHILLYAAGKPDLRALAHRFGKDPAAGMFLRLHLGLGLRFGTATGQHGKEF